MGKSRTALTLTLLNECPRYPAPRRQVETVLCDAYARRRREEATVTLLLVDDVRMADYNRRFHGRAGPTDVLAFEDGAPDPGSGRVHLGDIVVSVATARREARARKLRVRDEVTLYALHGLLHLLGMRDDTPEARAAMERAQAEMFRRHGLTTDLNEGA